MFWTSPCALHPISQRFPQCCLWSSSSVCLIDKGPLSSFQGRLSSASFFHSSLSRFPWRVKYLSCIYVPYAVETAFWCTKTCVIVLLPEWLMDRWLVGFGGWNSELDKLAIYSFSEVCLELVNKTFETEYVWFVLRHHSDISVLVDWS